MISYNFGILFGRRQRINSAHTQRKDIIQRQPPLDLKLEAVKCIHILNKQSLLHQLRKVQLQTEKRMEMEELALCGTLKFCNGRNGTSANAFVSEQWLPLSDCTRERERPELL